MSLHRRAARRDANEPAIIDALRECGALVIPISAEGFADLVAYYQGEIYLLEVKTKKGTLTDAQKVVHGDWPIHVVRSPEDALKMIGAIHD